MLIYEHKSYDDYVNAQVETNKKKLDRVFVRQEVVDSIVDYALNNIKNLNFGLCHGVRNAKEVELFRALLNADIIGTEISPTANQFEHTIQWDFHDVKDEWLGAVDFIYSNSFDHSFNPKMCLEQWLSCLSTTGLCFLEWSLMSKSPKNGLESMKADCFGADLSEYRELIQDVGIIVDELPLTLQTDWIEKRGWKDDRVIFVIKGKDNG